jgi:hypothetical protein
METIHPIEIQHSSTNKKIASQAFNYPTDYNSIMSIAGMNIKWPG